ncbi:HAMP domain-containing sensor histidine kinase [Streptomyces sp. Rer75]|uniref:sensor histidine kinase n=1 Tax=Streptomyces sp. Rer75 TaxID=2750011 RepID=UPI0015D01752|nr:HAMP domain-containing sensor histidine kinase [Streptomyces sp. Rer75]QLH23796.1 HAMP domain-containing protein [Streptomyces sp. Rer75]
MSVDTEDPPREPDPSGRAPREPRFRRKTDALLQADALLDRWPFRRKLNVLVVVPVVVVGVLLGVGAYGQVQQALDAGRTAQLVRDSQQVTRLINDIQAEHRQALLLAVEQESARPGADLPSTVDYRRMQRATDEQATEVRSAFGSGLAKEEGRALDYVGGLGVLRDKVERGSVPAAGIDPAYANAVGYLIDGIGLDRFSGSSSSSVVELLDTVLRADAAHAAFESGVFSAQTRDANALTEYTRAAGAHRIYEEQTDRFGRIADPDQVLRLEGIERSAEENGFDAKFAELQIDPGSLQGQSPQALRKAIAAGTQQAEDRLDVTGTLTDQIAARADSLSEDALRKAVALLGLAVLGFAAWLGFSFLVRHSVVRPLAALTGAAHQVVEVAGEELARVEDEDDESADSTPLRPRPIPVPVRDEIGDLAEAFNQVQVTAAALLERQVLSRRNVGEMFGNVGRRVSNLTTRQLTLIDAVEREETAPEVLERLYRIDHIAVRLQRNADSLMLLAGIREAELDAQPTALANVIRASLGRIEGFQRVSLRSETEVTVAPDIIGDLTLMVAELLENAVAFSPSETPVEVVVRPGTDITADGGALIEVIDHGLGMGAERLEEENARLIRRERLDLVPTKVLGLFVVGSLARRWGIRVTLSRTPGGGVTATVWIPDALLMAVNAGDTAPAPSPVVTELARTGAGPSGREPGDSAGSAGSADSAPASTGATPLPVRTPAPAPESRQAAPAQPGGLPRRIPNRRGAEGTWDPAEQEPSTEQTPSPTGEKSSTGERPSMGEKPSAASTSRPLRRRVRGATLDKTTPSADRGIAAVRAPADADAVRSELDEFEAAVRRAQQDSATTPTEPTPLPHQQTRKESGSDHADR